MDERETDVSRVDLGEDLLAKKSTQVEIPKADVEDGVDALIARARILKSENFLEDAKKIFRKILIQNTDHAVAKAELHDIQKMEYERIISPAGERKQKYSQDGVKKDESIKSTVRLLEREIGQVNRSHSVAVSELFGSQEEYAKYQSMIVNRVLKYPPKERIDVGIAYLVMELYDVARQIFESIVRYEDHKIEGNYLLAQALIKSEKAIDATLKLEPLVRDLTIDEKSKTDLLYLMGLAFESMSDEKRAKNFYNRVYQLNPKYIDVLEKIK